MSVKWHISLWRFFNGEQGIISSMLNKSLLEWQSIRSVLYDTTNALTDQQRAINTRYDKTLLFMAKQVQKEHKNIQ